MKKVSLLMKILMYSLSIFLMIWYCKTLIDSLKPEVSLEYKMHYIDKTLTDWPGDNGLNYKLNTELMFGSEYDNNVAKCRGNGWYQADKKANWTSNECEIYLNISDYIINSGNMELVLQCAVPKSKVSININGKNIAIFNPSENREKYIFPIPKEILEEKFLCIQFKIDGTKTVRELKQQTDREYTNNYNDKDELGICVESIKLG